MRLIYILFFITQIITVSHAAPDAGDAKFPALGQTGEAEILTVKTPLEREMSGGETRDFLVTAAAGEAVLITVEQRGIDVAVAVYDAARAGEKINETDFSYGIFGTEELFFIAERAGEFRIGVNLPDKTAEPGSFRIELVARRPANNDDRQEYLAQKTFSAGESLRLKSTSESLKEALGKYVEADRLWSEIGNEKRIALAAYYKVIVYFALGNLKNALPIAQRAIPLWRKVGNRHMEAATLDQAGVLANAIGERQAAIDFYAQSLRLWRELKNAQGEGSALSNLAGVYLYFGDYRRALEFYEQALPLRSAGTDKSGTASTLNNIGVCFDGLGEPVKAAQFYRESLAVSKEINDFNIAAHTLSGLSELARNAGDIDGAFEYLHEAIQLNRKTGNRFDEAVRLAHRTDLYRFVGDYERALEAQRQSYNLASQTGNRDAKLHALVSLGRIYYERGDYEKSRQSNLQAVELAKALGSEAVVARLLDSIGMALLYADRTDEALDYLNQAKALWRKTGLLVGAAENFYNLGSFYRRKGDFAASFENFRQSLSNAEQARAGKIQIWANYEIARRNLEENDLPAALASIEKAVDLSESMRSNISRDDFRVSYFAGSRKIYELYIEILLQLAGENKTALYIDRALEASEKARARSLVELLNQSGANIKNNADAHLLKIERDINNRLSAKAARQTRLLSGGQTGAAPADELRIVAREISDLLGEREKLAAQIRRASPNYAALTQPVPLKAAEIKALLDKDTILLEYALGEAQSFLWLATNDSISVFKLPKREEIENLARAFYESLQTNGGQINLKAGRELSEILLKPVSDQIGGKRIVVVGEGALQFVPFAALPDPKSENQFLIQTNEIVSLASASTLAILRRETEKRKPAAKTVAIFADPVFSPADPRLKNRQTAKPENSAGERLQRSFEETSGGEENLKTIPRLPFSRREAEAIFQIVPPRDNLKAVDFAANAKAAGGENLSDYKIIHFATHGLLNSKNPELSGLVLSLVNEKGEPQNGFLRLSDIYNLRLNSHLVVLSACQTALGRDIRGEGLIGLTRGFMYAGAPRVVAGLWKVDDAATAELMRHFYQNMLQKKQRPAEALRAAQIEMSRDERYKSPYYWAAFVLQGEWR